MPDPQVAQHECRKDTVAALKERLEARAVRIKELTAFKQPGPLVLTSSAVPAAGGVPGG